MYITYCYAPSGEESTAKQPGCLPSKELFRGGPVVFMREDVQRTRTGHGLGAIRGAQFGQEMLDVEFDGMQAEDQLLGDLLVGAPLGHQLQDAALPCT